MPVTLDHFVGPFRQVWSLAGRSLVVDAKDRQVVRPASDLGGLSWPEEREDWERLAPVLAGSVALYEQAERLAARLEGPGVRRVDGRIVLEEGDVGEFLDALDRIRASMPKAPPAPEEDDGAAPPPPGP